jgi:hypothetical protein
MSVHCSRGDMCIQRSLIGVAEAVLKGIGFEWIKTRLAACRLSVASETHTLEAVVSYSISGQPAVAGLKRIRLSRMINKRLASQSSDAGKIALMSGSSYHWCV